MVAWICGIWGGIIALSLPNVLMWSALMRVDMLFVALSVGGFYFGLRALTQPKAIHAAALCFVGAIYTKQTAIAAPAAVFATLLYLRPQTAWRGIATTLAASFIALVPVLWFSDGGFFRHILLYNVNRINIENGQRTFGVVKASWPYCAVAAWAMYARLSRIKVTEGSLRQRLIDSPSEASSLMLRVYFVLATLMLLLVFKSGASTNYYLEWQFLLGIYAGIALFETLYAGNPMLKPALRQIIVCAGLAFVGWKSVTNLAIFDGYYLFESDYRHARVAPYTLFCEAIEEPEKIPELLRFLVNPAKIAEQIKLGARWGQLAPNEKDMNWRALEAAYGRPLIEKFQTNVPTDHGELCDRLTDVVMKITNSFHG